MVYVGSGFMARSSRQKNYSIRRSSRRRRSRGRGRGGNGMMIFAIGAGAGYLAPRIHPMQDMIVTALAVLPVRTGIRGLKFGAQGYVAGMIARQIMPGLLGGFGSGGSGGSFV